MILTCFQLESDIFVSAELKASLEIVTTLLFSFVHVPSIPVARCPAVYEYFIQTESIQHEILPTYNAPICLHRLTKVENFNSLASVSSLVI